ncbi:MAG TPA: hypothetical protein VE684_22390 [Crenalkalicoccus sp.]|nr:hypothetical protein [Crenalkalicoccus sp.]
MHRHGDGRRVPAAAGREDVALGGQKFGRARRAGRAPVAHVPEELARREQMLDRSD